MKVLYISPRYHTNQNAIIAGWQQAGDEVRIFAQYEGRVENHAALRPLVLGYAPWFERYNDWYVHHLKKKDPAAKDMRLRWGVPPIRRIRKEIEAYDPDLVILRERNLYTMRCYSLVRRMGIPVIMWNLSPVYAEPGYFKHDLAHFLVRGKTPLFRFTPTRQIGIDMTGKERDPYSYFAPFVVEPKCAPEERSYLQEGRINLFEIGKYQDRKNHFLMVRAFARLKERYPKLHLCIAGECSDDFHRDYYRRLTEEIEQRGLSREIELYQNLSKEEVDAIYRRSDIYILTSTGEPASITVIEAMSYSIPAVSGTDNGTADYIRPDVTGEVFADCDEEDLVRKLDRILENAEETIPRMGRAAYRSICEDFGFGVYRQTIETMLADRETYIKERKFMQRRP